MTISRIYVVDEKSTTTAGQRRLVEASSAAQAIRHCVSNVYTAQAAGPKDVAELMGAGIRIERATETQTQQTN